MAKARKKRPSQLSVFPEPVYSRFIRRLGVTEKEYAELEAFQRLKGAERLKAARKIIADAIIEAAQKPDARCTLAIAESESLLKGYATLDDQHRAEIANLIEQITEYLRDASRKRPFNALMLAAPGAGKSHFIRQLAGKMRADRVQAVTFNMATMQSTDDMAQPVDELRNLKVNDRFPLLFLDEFDSDPARYPALLPLLWEGALHVGHRDLRLGKAVIVLAGSNPDLPKTMDQSAKMGLNAEGQEEPTKAGKLVDLLSRINGGVINIPDFDLRTDDRDRRIDKVCVTVALLRDRFGDHLRIVPRSLLRFIAHTTFRYGVRSIAHLVDVIDGDAYHDGELDGGGLGLPTGREQDLRQSSLRLHLLDKDQAFGIVNRWAEFAKDKAVLDLRGKKSAHFSPGRSCPAVDERRHPLAGWVRDLPALTEWWPQFAIGVGEQTESVRARAPYVRPSIRRVRTTVDSSTAGGSYPGPIFADSNRKPHPNVAQNAPLGWGTLESPASPLDYFAE